MSKDIAKLKHWLSLRGNGEAKLAALLGYRSSVTIHQWIERGNIPEHQVLRVLEIVDGDTVKPSKKGQGKKTAPDLGVWS